MQKVNSIITSMPQCICEKNRVQSASSIKTLNQCPRKYFYKYIQEIDEGTNIYAIRGKAAHTALENLFTINEDQLDIISTQPDILSTLKAITRNFFDMAWVEQQDELKTINMSAHEIKQYHDETINMLMDYVEYTYNNLKGDFITGFNNLKPTTVEEEIVSENLGIRGFIDVQKKENNEHIILDYKTSGRINMQDHIFQLGMYALLINDKHNFVPDKAGIIYLKFGGKTDTIDITPELLKDTLFKIEQAHIHTKSSNKIDYPKKMGPLCKWRTGQCGFYDICIKDDD